MLASIKGRNSVANLRKTTIYNTNVDLVNDDVRGSSNKFLQWSHISEIVTKIRILLLVACGHGYCLLIFEISSFYHNLIWCYTNTIEVRCLSVRNKLCIRYSNAQQATNELQRITTFVSV